MTCMTCRTLACDEDTLIPLLIHSFTSPTLALAPSTLANPCKTPYTSLNPSLHTTLPLNPSYILALYLNPCLYITLAPTPCLFLTLPLTLSLNPTPILRYPYPFLKTLPPNYASLFFTLTPYFLPTLAYPYTLA